MKNKKIKQLMERGLSHKLLLTMNEGQINQLHKMMVSEITMVPKTDTATIDKLKNEKKPFEVYEQGVEVDKSDSKLGQTTQEPHQVQAPDGMDDDGDATIDKEEDIATEGVIKEKFESKAQQGLFWARCEKCSSKNCKWCKMAREFSDSTSKKQYEKMPEKKHPEKTVKVEKNTNEGLEKFLEKKIIEMVESSISPKMKKKDLIKTIKKKTKNDDSMIIRRPKKLTMFSDEAPMELPIAKMFSIGKK